MQNEETEDKTNLIKFFKYISKSRILNTEGQAKQIARLEEEISLLKHENKNKQMHIENLALESKDLKMKIENLERSTLDLQKNANISYEQAIENNIIAFNILKVRTFKNRIFMGRKLTWQRI